MSIHKFPSQPGLSSLDAALAERDIRLGVYRMQSEVRRRVRRHMRWQGVLRHWPWLVLGVVAGLAIAAGVVTLMVSHEARVGALVGLAMGLLIATTLWASER